MSGITRPLVGQQQRLWSLLALALCLGLAISAALAQADLKFPALTARIVDGANIIPIDARARIEAKLAAYEQKTSDQVVVATVPSLQDTSVEDFGNRLFRFWKLGQAKTNNGVLLLIAPNERKVRIEVGYGLEGTLTDALSSMIITGAVAPKFKAGNFAGGIEDGVDAIMSVLQKDGEWQDRLKLRNQDTPEDYDFMVILFAFLLLFFLFVMLSQRAQQRGSFAHRRKNGGWIVGSPTSSGWGGGGGGWSSGSSSGGGYSGGGGGSSGGGGASGSW